MKRLHVFCDESAQKGRYYSNFYGGLLVTGEDLHGCEQTILQQKEALNLYREVKWNKVSSGYVEKYIALMQTFFVLIRENKIKLRIMFSQNCYVAEGLTQYQQDNTYFLLYYQLIKHAFGLRYAFPGTPKEVHLYFDRMPDTREKVMAFRSHLFALCENAAFRHNRVNLRYENISEVDSHAHPLLQCLDIVLGAMQFRLNEFHKVKPEGSNRRAKGTIAREKLYKHILTEIRTLSESHRHFNIGISTGQPRYEDKWENPYRHWNFQPATYRLDAGKTKRSSKKGPLMTTSIS